MLYEPTQITSKHFIIKERIEVDIQMGKFNLRLKKGLGVKYFHSKIEIRNFIKHNFCARIC